MLGNPNYMEVSVSSQVPTPSNHPISRWDFPVYTNQLLGYPHLRKPFFSSGKRLTYVMMDCWKHHGPISFFFMWMRKNRFCFFLGFPVPLISARWLAMVPKISQLTNYAYTRHLDDPASHDPYWALLQYGLIQASVDSPITWVDWVPSQISCQPFEESTLTMN